MQNKFRATLMYRAYRLVLGQLSHLDKLTFLAHLIEMPAESIDFDGFQW